MNAWFLVVGDEGCITDAVWSMFEAFRAFGMWRTQSVSRLMLESDVDSTCNTETNVAESFDRHKEPQSKNKPTSHTTQATISRAGCRHAPSRRATTIQDVAGMN